MIYTNVTWKDFCRSAIITVIIVVFLSLLMGCCKKEVSITTCPPLQRAQLSDIETLMQDYDTLYSVYNECAGL